MGEGMLKAAVTTWLLWSDKQEELGDRPQSQETVITDALAKTED